MLLITTTDKLKKILEVSRRAQEAIRVRAVKEQKKVNQDREVRRLNYIIQNKRSTPDRIQLLKDAREYSLYGRVTPRPAAEDEEGDVVFEGHAWNFGRAFDVQGARPTTVDRGLAINTRIANAQQHAHGNPVAALSRLIYFNAVDATGKGGAVFASLPVMLQYIGGFARKMLEVQNEQYLDARVLWIAHREGEEAPTYPRSTAYATSGDALASLVTKSLKGESSEETRSEGYKYILKTITLAIVLIREPVDNEELGRGSSGTGLGLRVANETWSIIDTPASKNCGWIAFNLAAFLKHDPKLMTDIEHRQRKGKDMKKTLLTGEKNFAAKCGFIDLSGTSVGKDHFQVMSTYYRVPIDVYDIEWKLKYHIDPDMSIKTSCRLLKNTQPLVSLQFEKEEDKKYGHYAALIPWDLLGRSSSSTVSIPSERTIQEVVDRYTSTVRREEQKYVATCTEIDGVPICQSREEFLEDLWFMKVGYTRQADGSLFRNNSMKNDKKNKALENKVEADKNMIVKILTYKRSCHPGGKPIVEEEVAAKGDVTASIEMNDDKFRIKPKHTTHKKIYKLEKDEPVYTRSYVDKDKYDLIHPEDLQEMINMGEPTYVWKFIGQTKYMDQVYLVHKQKMCLGIYDLETASERPVEIDGVMQQKDYQHKAYAAGFTHTTYGMNYDASLLEAKDNYIEFLTDPECEGTAISKFMDHLYDLVVSNAKKGIKTILYAHNGGKFDFNVIMNHGFGKFSFAPDKTIYSNGRWISVVLKCKYKGKGSDVKEAFVKFGDSYSHKATSLDALCQSLKPRFAKLGHVDFGCIYSDNALAEMDRQDIHKYLKHDVLSLWEIMYHYDNVIKNEFKLSIYNIPTAASLAGKRNFTKYYPKASKHIYMLPKSIDTFIRNSYFGGRTEAFIIGKVPAKKIYYYDITSSYPYCMQMKMPCGRPMFVDFVGHSDPADKSRWTLPQPTSDIPDSVPFGFWRVIVSGGPAKGVKLHGVKTDRLLFPIFDKPREMILFSEEIVKGMYHNYKYEFIHGYKFLAEPILCKAAQDLYKKKDEATNEVERDLNKTVVNSLYGLFGLNWQERNSISIISREKHMELELEGSLDNVSYILGETKDDDVSIVRTKKEISNDFRSVAISAAITSYGRIRMYDIMCDIEKAGGTIYYSDTDSVITDLNLNAATITYKTGEIVNLGRKWITGELGGLKNEAHAKLIGEDTKTLKKQMGTVDGIDLEGEVVKLQRQGCMRYEKDAMYNFKGEEPYFDKCTILGLKMYDLEKSNGMGHEWYKGFIKGVTQRKHVDKSGKVFENKYLPQDFEDFFNGNVIEEDETGEVRLKQVRCGQLNFSCPATSILDSSNRAAVVESTIVKCFSMYNKDGTYKYTKGHVGPRIGDTMYITPLKTSELNK
jgi:hypothetical protein